MIRQSQTEWEVQTRGRGFHEITPEVEYFVKESGIRSGLLTLHLMHTSASLLVQENADPDVRTDLEAFFKRLVVDGDRLFVHTTEGPDDMPAHIRAALTTVSVTIPIREGGPALGTWQGVYIWEHRTSPHRRRVVAHVIGE